MNYEQSGPLMLCATKVLKPGPARVGKIAGDFSLPRTVPVPVLLAGGAGFIVGVLFSAVFFGSFVGIMAGGTIGAGIGWVAVTYSPLSGESLGKWASLEVASRLRRVEIDGERVRVYVGVCLVPDVPRGSVSIIAGAVNVAPGSVDDRGRFIEVTGRPAVLVPPVATSRRYPAPPFPAGPAPTHRGAPPPTAGPTLPTAPHAAPPPPGAPQ